MRFIRLIGQLILLILLSCGFTTWIVGADMFYSDGNQFNKSQGKIPSREPYEVVDTIKMVAGTGSIVLHAHTTKEKHNLRPTSHNLRRPCLC